MEAFELLMDASEFNSAAGLLIGATSLLDRWGYGQYLEGQHHRLVDRLDADGTATILHNLGNLVQNRGLYDQALEYYDQSIKLKEELGNRLGIANSLHQIGIIQQKRGNYDEALEHYDRSLKVNGELATAQASQMHIIKSATFISCAERMSKRWSTTIVRLKIDEELGARLGVAVSLHQIGMILQEQGDYRQALEHYESFA